MKKIIILFSLVFMLQGCNDALEILPDDRLNSEAFFKTGSSEEIASAVNSIYQPLQRSYMYNLRMWTLDIVANEGIVGNEAGGNGLETIQMSNFITTSDNSGAKELWRGPWQGINRANWILDNIANAENAVATKKSQYEGEAYFLRALYYFNAVRLFGDVPLFTHQQTADDNLNVSRTPQEDVYDQIVSDLTTAASLLPPSYEGKDIGRATKGAALGLLAKVHLTRKRYPLVISTVESLMGLNVYALNEDYADNFNALKENGKESLFEVQYEKDLGFDPFDVNGQGAWHAQYMAPVGSPVGGPQWGGGFGWFHVNPEFVNSFETGDKRKTVSVFVAGDVYNGWVYNPELSRTGFTVKKFISPYVGVNQPMDSPLNFPVLRYSDVLLMYAEALNELGETSEACAPATDPNNGGPLNRVRVRAGLPNISGDQEEVREIIRHERRIELAFEGGHRWFDLIRYEENGEYAKDYFHGVGKTNFTLPKHLLLPIPFDDIQSNPNLSPNNPGY